MPCRSGFEDHEIANAINKAYCTPTTQVEVQK